MLTANLVAMVVVKECHEETFDSETMQISGMCKPKRTIVFPILIVQESHMTTGILRTEGESPPPQDVGCGCG